jgi:hypothetical protein
VAAWSRNRTTNLKRGCIEQGRMTLGMGRRRHHVFMMCRMKAAFLAVLVMTCIAIAPAVDARTVHRCVLDGTVSLSTAPEPGSRCEPVEVDDADPRQPNLWGALGVVSGNLYRREQDGRTVYGTRELPGSVKLQSFVVETPAAVPTYEGRIGPPRLDRFAAEFAASARATGVEDAWLRAIAHAESGFDPQAESHKGAQGVMQLMPATAAEYGVDDPFAAGQSIRAGAQHLRMLMRLYGGDLTLVAAAYNAGIGTLARYGGVPPYPETQTYVARVLALHQRYREALAAPAALRHAG